MIDCVDCRHLLSAHTNQNDQTEDIKPKPKRRSSDSAKRKEQSLPATNTTQANNQAPASVASPAKRKKRAIRL